MQAVGLDIDSAVALGKRMEQNAIVFIEKGKVPELLVLV